MFSNQSIGIEQPSFLEGTGVTIQCHSLVVNGILIEQVNELED